MKWLERSIGFLSLLWVACLTWWVCARLVCVGRRNGSRSANRALQAWGRRVFRFLSTEVVIDNPHGVALTEGKRYLVMSNHQSHLDIPLLFYALDGKIRMMAKRELFRIPIFGRAMQRSGCVSVTRGDPKAGKESLLKARTIMESGQAFWVAPEGTRSLSGQLQAFKKGGFLLAFQTDADIIPVRLSGTRERLPAQSLCLTRGGQVNVTIGKPIAIEGYSVRTLRDLMQTVAQFLEFGPSSTQ